MIPVLNYFVYYIILNMWYFEDVRFPDNINVLPVVHKSAQSCHFKEHVCICITVFGFF